MRGWLAALLLGLAAAPVAAGEPVNQAALMAAKPARLLSEYRLFADGPAQTPNTGVHPYDLITPLFTDYALKYRFVHVPAGQPAGYDATEAFAFPVGTTLVKTFAYPADLRAPDQDVRLIETRLLIHQPAGWTAWAYVWDARQSDAVLKLAGKRLDIGFIGYDGQARQIRYAVPNKNQCKGCHQFNEAIVPLGPKARNLNHAFAYPSGPRNQLAYWSDMGLLAGAPAPEAAPALPAWDDAAAPLDARARGYLDVNCAHCHRREGPANTSGLFLTYGEDEPVAWGLNKRPVAAGRGSGGLAFDIAPGAPDRSILVYRMEALEPDIMMPELGRTIPHPEGIALIREWIAAMEN